MLDLVEIRVEERVHVPICFRCCAFGHIAKFCRAALATCSECGETGHERKDCSSQEKRCYNCRRFLGVVSGHSAMDPTCPCVIKKREQQKAKINYNG